MKRSSPYRWVILGVYMLLTLVNELQWLSHAAVARPAAVFYEGQFNPGSFFNIDFLALSYMLVYLAVSLPASWVTDRFGIRIGLGIGAFLTGSFALIKGIWASSFLMVLIAQTGLAIAQPFIINSVTAMSVRWFPLNERGMAAGLSALAQYLGIVVAMLLTPLLVGSDPGKPGYGEGFQSMLMIYGLISLGVAILSMILIRERPANQLEEHEFAPKPFFEGMRHILRQRDMVITIVLFLIGLGIFNAVSSMTDAIAAHAGVSDSDGLIGGLMLIGGIIGALVLPALSDRMRKRKPFLVVTIAGMIPGLAGMAFASRLWHDPETVYTVILVSSFVLGFFVMSAGPIGFQYAAEVCAPAPESASQGILLWVGQISGLIFAAGMSMSNSRYISFFLILFAVLSIFTLIGTLLLRESKMMRYL